MLKIFMAELQELFDPPMYIFSGYAFASQWILEVVECQYKSML
jgi:hypothetical protein